MSNHSLTAQISTSLPISHNSMVSIRHEHKNNYLLRNTVLGSYLQVTWCARSAVKSKENIHQVIIIFDNHCSLLWHSKIV